MACCLRYAGALVAAPLEDRLDSWKEIAAYLGRGIRTVQRWEREEGLPVHRLAHDKRGTIYARREEIAAWWESRQVALAAPPETTPVEASGSRRLERVTWTLALTSWPALSSDAKLIAYVSDGGKDGEPPQVWVQQIGGAALRLTSGVREYSHLSFSPEDTRIVFTASDESGPGVYEVPALGGEPRLLHSGASRGRISPDGRWFACVPQDSIGIRITPRDGAGFRALASSFVDVASMVWSPDSRSLLVHARPDPSFEPDWWVVPIDGAPPIEIGIVGQFRATGLFVLPTAAAWTGDSIVFSAAGPNGVHLQRQRIAASSFLPIGAAEQLTTGSETAWLPTAAAGRVAYFSTRADANLWSVPLDATGVAGGPARRLTRGPYPLGYLTLTADGRTLAYFSFRVGRGGVFLRDLQDGSEKLFDSGPAGDRGYPAISPLGRLVAFGMRMPGAGRALRPIFIANLPDGTCRSLGDDCGGRPREWVDERWLVIERFTQRNSVALIETDTATQCELLSSGERSVSNPRLSPDRRWIAFDASPPGGSPCVFVAPFQLAPIPESVWREVDRPASHPFWSADGRLLYYTPITTNPTVRSAVRARRFDATSGDLGGEPIAVYRNTEMLMPAYLAGTSPIATAHEILLVLGDFRGDVWLMDLR